MCYPSMVLDCIPDDAGGFFWESFNAGVRDGVRSNFLTVRTILGNALDLQIHKESLAYKLNLMYILVLNMTNNDAAMYTMSQ